MGKESISAFSFVISAETLPFESASSSRPSARSSTGLNSGADSSSMERPSSRTYSEASERKGYFARSAFVSMRSYSCSILGAR